MGTYGLIEFARKRFITKTIRDSSLWNNVLGVYNIQGKNGSALVWIGHPHIISLLFSLEN